MRHTRLPKDSSVLLLVLVLQLAIKRLLRIEAKRHQCVDARELAHRRARDAGAALHARLAYLIGVLLILLGVGAVNALLRDLLVLRQYLSRDIVLTEVADAAIGASVGAAHVLHAVTLRQLHV